MNILMISNLDNDEKLEDIWIARAFQQDGHKIAMVYEYIKQGSSNINIEIV